jgi:hypothetical protein
LTTDNTSKTTDSQVVTAIKRTEQVSLLQLGIEGITSKTESSKMLGMDVPGNQRAKYIQHNFDAELGTKGKDVTAESTQAHQFTVSIPKFIFIGYNNVKYQVAAENSGAMSWTTPDIDSTELINKLLNDKVNSTSNRTTRRCATRRRSSTGVDPDTKVTFQFT